MFIFCGWFLEGSSSAEVSTLLIGRYSIVLHLGVNMIFRSERCVIHDSLQIKEPKVYVHGNIKNEDLMNKNWPGC